MPAKKSGKRKGMSKAERTAYNKWLWNITAEDYNKMNQKELATIAKQFQRQFAVRAKQLDKLQADTGISSKALETARNAFKNTRFITGPQFLPSSHIERGGKIRYSVNQLRSIVSNYAAFFNEGNGETIRTNTVEGAKQVFENMVLRLNTTHAKVSDALKVPAKELTPADYQAMWKAYNLFKELYVEAFAILGSDYVQQAMYATYQEMPNGYSTLDMVNKMFEWAQGRKPLNGDLSKDYRNDELGDNYDWGPELEKHLIDSGAHIIKWRNNL